MSDALTTTGVAVTLAVSLFAAWRAWRTDNSSSSRADFAELRAEASELRDEVKEQRDEARAAVVRLEERVGELEVGMRHEKRQRGLAVTYIGTLVAALRRADVPVPDPPAGLEVDLHG